MKKIIFLAAILVANTASAQITFQKTFGGTLADDGASVQQTTDGGYIITGSTISFGAGLADVYLVKTDAIGDTLWTKAFGGIDNDYGKCVQQTTDGGYVIAGTTESFGAGMLDIYLIKTNTTGDTLWTKTYGGIDWDEGYSVQQTTDGGYIITGYTESFGAGMSDIYLVKTDANGGILWTKAFGGIDNDYGQSVQQTSDGGYIITGYTESFGAGMLDIYLIKTNTTGDTLWTKTFGGINSDYGRYVQQTTDGGFVIAGTTSPNVTYVVKADMNGDIIWTKTYGQASDFCFSIQQTTDGGYILTGTTASFAENVYDIFLIKTNSLGDTLWTKTYGLYFENWGYDVQQTSDNGYIIIGLIQFFPGNGDELYLIKTDSIGNTGCGEFNKGTVVGSTSTLISSGAIIGSGGVVNSTATTVSNTLTNDSTICSNIIGISTYESTYQSYYVYPNPTTGKFRVESSEFGVETIEIYDLFGRKVLATRETEIDMSSYPSGLYVWQVGTARGKIVLE